MILFSSHINSYINYRQRFEAVISLSYGLHLKMKEIHCSGLIFFHAIDIDRDLEQNCVKKSCQADNAESQNCLALLVQETEKDVLCLVYYLQMLFVDQMKLKSKTFSSSLKFVTATLFYFYKREKNFLVITNIVIFQNFRNVRFHSCLISSARNVRFHCV